MERIRRIIFWLVAGVAVLVVLVFLGVQLFFPAEKVRQLAESEGSAALGHQLTIGSVGLSLLGGPTLRLDSLSIAGSDSSQPELATCPRVEVSIRFWPLLVGKVLPEHILLSRPVVTLAVDSPAAGDLSGSPGADTSSDKSSANMLALLPALEVRDGTFRYTDLLGNTQVVADGLNVSTEINRSRTDVFHLSGKLTVDTLRITSGWSYPAITTTLDWQLTYDPTIDQATIETGRLKINDMQFVLGGSATGLTGKPSLRLSVDADRITARQLFSLLPTQNREMLREYDVSGEVTSHVTVEYPSSSMKQPVRYSGSAEVSDFVMSTPAVSGKLQVKRTLIDFQPDTARISLEGGTFAQRPIKGHLVISSFAHPTVNGELGGSLDLAILRPFLPARVGQGLSGLMSFSLAVSGRPRDLRSLKVSGPIKITQGAFTSPLLPQPIDVFDLDLHLDDNLVRVNDMSAEFKDGVIHFTGRLDQLLPYLLTEEGEHLSPQVDGRLTGDFSLAAVQPLLPSAGKPTIKGKVKLDLRLDGMLNQPATIRPRGQVTITEAAYNDSLLPEPIRKLEADLRIFPDSVVVNALNAEFASSDVSLTGRLFNPFPYLLPLTTVHRDRLKRPEFFFDLRSHRFDSDRLFPQAVPGSGEEHPEIGDSISVALLPDIDGRGSIAVDTLIYSQVMFTHLKGKVRIARRIIDCYDITTDVYGGKTTGRTTIDLTDMKRPKYVGNFTASRLEANDFVSRFTPLRNSLFGKLDVTAKYAAAGWDRNSFLGSLSMDGSGSMKEGSLKTSGEIYKALKAIGEKFGQNLSPDQPLKQLSSVFTIRDGSVAFDGLKTSLPQLGDIQLTGGYGFDGKIDCKGKLQLSEALTAKLSTGKSPLGALSGLLGKGGNRRIDLPFALEGALDGAMKVNLDFKALTRDAARELGDKAGNLLKGFKSGRSGP